MQNMTNMMNKFLFAFLSLLFFPTFGWALEDACTNPEKFTIDKRCYVTEEQKQQKPYNAVVGILQSYNDISCTGTIVKIGDKLFMYTAKHCVSQFSMIATSLHFITVDNRDIVANVVNVGDFDDMWFEIENPDGDWAFYSFKEQDLPYVNISNKSGDDNAVSVGYGALKILQDSEIREMKEQYLDYMRRGENQYGEKVDLDPNEDEEWGVVANGGLKTFHPAVKTFINKYFYERFMNDSLNMKVSFCKYSSQNKTMGCQGWTGDSGGGLFDSDGNITAIRSTGKGIIGGDNHAGIKDEEGFIAFPTATK